MRRTMVNLLAAVALAAAVAQTASASTPAPAPASPESAPMTTASADGPAARWAALAEQTMAAYRADRNADMGRLAGEALALAEAHFAPGDPRIARSLTLSGLAHLAASEHAEAEALLRRALSIIDAAGTRDSIEAAATLNYLGEALMARGQHDEAQPLMVEALATARARGGDGHIDTIRAAHAYGVLLQLQRQLSEAESVMLRARAAGLETLGPSHHAMLELQASIAAVMMATGRESEANDLYREAITLSTATHGEDFGTTIGLNSGLAIALAEQGRYGESEPLFRRVIAAETRRSGAEHGNVLSAQLSLADIVSQRGDVAQGERSARDILGVVDRRYGSRHPLAVSALETMARIVSSQGRIEEALGFQQRAVATRREAEGPDSSSTLYAELRLADYLSAAGNRAEAERLYRRFGDIMQRSLGADSPTVLITEGRLVEMFNAAADYRQSLPAAQALLPRLERMMGRNHPTTLRTLFLLAQAHWGLGDRASAHPVLSDALDRSVAGMGPLHPETTLIASSLAYLRIEMPEHHATAIVPAGLVSDALRSRNRREAGASDALAQSIAARNRAADAANLTLVADALWLGRNSDNEQRYVLRAFQALQNATAGGTDQAVLRTAARQAAAARDPALAGLVARRETVEGQWTRASTAFTAALAEAGEAGDALRQQRRTELQRVERELQQIDADIRTRFPDYFALVRPEALSQEATQAMLAPDEAVLMIVPTDYGTHVMALNKTQGTWLRADITREQIDWSVRRLLFDLGAPVDVTMSEAAEWQEEGGRGYPFSRRSAWVLYTHLVGPVQRILEGKRHVFVVTSGSLTSLPLGVLVTEEPTGADGDPAALRATRWLADQHALIRVPTLQSLHLQRRMAAQAPAGTTAAGFLGFGDPLLDGEAQTRGGGRGATRGTATRIADAFAGGAADDGTNGVPLANISALKRMARLPGTATELANMRRALGAPASSVRLGRAATEAAIRSADLGSARILALATHGLMAGEEGAFEPGLVFTPPREASSADDGLLTASEIAGLRLNAEWVILSACNTAAGDGSAGAPGLSGLAQAFFFAGARTLLASHWPVRDDVASRITVRTIEIQRDQPALSRAEAFQRAMQEIRNDASHDTLTDSWAHPNAWAPFTLIGDGAQ